MTEAEKEPGSIELLEETAAISDKPQLKINSFKDLRDMMIIAKGGDPIAAQTINDFINFKNNTERSNFPNSKTTLFIAQLNGYSRLYYPNEQNPFGLVAECVEIAFMARKGWKSGQFVEMVKQTPSIPDMVTIGEGQTRGIGDRLLGRGKE